MSSKKAIICTILFTVVLMAAWVGIGLTNEKLFWVVCSVLAGKYIADRVEKFYRWLIKDSSKEE